MKSHDQHTVARLLARIEELERKLAAMESSTDGEKGCDGTSRLPVDVPASDMVSRAGALRLVLGGAAATAGAGLLFTRQAGTALANGSEGPTSFSNASNPAVPAIRADGSGYLAVLATSAGDNNDPSVFGLSTSAGIGVAGATTQSTGAGGLHFPELTGFTGVLGAGMSNMDGIHGVSFRHDSVTADTGLLGSGRGVYGLTNTGVGVEGASYSDAFQTTPGSGTGLRGRSGSGNGVEGIGLTGVKGTGAGSGGRGGVFSGGAAQLKLTPSSATSHPATGQAGDLFMSTDEDDSAVKHLWVCTRSSTGTTVAIWVRLA